MSKLILCLILYAMTSSAVAKEAADCAVRIFQTDSRSGAPALLWEDTVTCVLGVPLSGAPLAFSCEINCSKIDSVGVDLSIHIVTFGATPYTTSRSFAVEYGLPAQVQNIAVKDGGIYSLEVRPLRKTERDTSDCPFTPSVTEGFDISPSANFDLHYVENSFGSFYWTAAREILEGKYRIYQKFFNLTLPGKYSVYLLPCQTEGTIWDSRFGVSIDPSRSVAHMLYSLEHNSVDAVVVCQMATLRTFGYAPPVLSEGMASYLSYTLSDMKRLMASGLVPPIDSLLNTRAFLQMSPRISDRCAASFTKYLIVAYGVDPFMKLYKKSTDLTLKEDAEEVYGKPILVLDREWRTFVDTSQILIVQLRAATAEAEMMMQYGSMLENAKEMMRTSKVTRDSLIALPLLERACFFTGDYYGAIDAKAELLTMDTTGSASRMTIGAYRMMSGQYDSAGANFQAALAQNPSDKIVAFNLALWHLYSTDDTARAKELLTGAGGTTAEGSSMFEARIRLAEILRQSKNVEDRKEARELFQQGVNGLLPQLQANMASTSTMLWLGAGYLGLGDSPTASDFLNTALMLESRPFYQGLIYLYLGKVSDHLGDHDGARAWYGRVLGILSADYHQREAKWLMDHPWAQGK
jgi:tetratricopeptide (TPR) repeat protein